MQIVIHSGSSEVMSVFPCSTILGYEDSEYFVFCFQ